MKRGEIKLGDHLRTTKGDHVTKIKHSGVVVGFSMWGIYDAVIMKRDADGVKKLYLVKNLVRV